MRAEVLRSYVEDLLETLTRQDKVKPDGDGDYPVRYRGALYYVRIVGDQDPVVQVFSVAVEGPKTGPEFYEHLNEINTRVKFARVMYVRDQVLVESELVAEGVTRESFGNACQAVAVISDKIAPALVEKFGGKARFLEERQPEPAEPPDEGPSVGMYL